jgi:hypothetical protein
MRRVVKQIVKQELSQTIDRKFGSLAMLVALSGTEITPEVETFLADVQHSRDPVQLRIQYRSHSIVVNIT